MPARKPSVSIRRPPATPVDPGAVERFIAGAAATSSAPETLPNVTPIRRQEAPAAPTSSPGRGIVTRTDGRTRRRTTVYLPPDLARQLAIFCAAGGRDLSDVVTDAVAAHLVSLRGG